MKIGTPSLIFAIIFAMILFGVIAFEISVSGNIDASFPVRANGQPFNIDTWKERVDLPAESTISVISTGDLMPGLGVGLKFKHHGLWVSSIGAFAGASLSFRDTAANQEIVGSASWDFLRLALLGGYEFGNERYGFGPLASYEQHSIKIGYCWRGEERFSREIVAHYPSVGFSGRLYFVEFSYCHPLITKGLSEAILSASFPIEEEKGIYGGGKYSVSWNSKERVDCFGCLLSWLRLW